MVEERLQTIAVPTFYELCWGLAEMNDHFGARNMDVDSVVGAFFGFLITLLNLMTFLKFVHTLSFGHVLCNSMSLLYRLEPSTRFVTLSTSIPIHVTTTPVIPSHSIVDDCLEDSCLFCVAVQPHLQS